MAALLLGTVYAAAQTAPACADNAISDEQRIPVDGASVYLLVRGDRCDAPLMLWLHGGPGGAQTPLFRLYDRGLENEFLVAYWDQRGAGQSYDPNADTTKLTVERHIADLKIVVGHLRAQYAKRKVALVGHSWGSALGLLYAQRHPGDVSLVVGVNQFVSGLGAQQGQLEFVRSRAEALRDDKTLQRLNEIGRPPLSSTNELQLQALVDRYGGLFHRRPSFAMAMIEGSLRGYAAPWDIPAYIRANEVSLAAMEKEINALDLAKTVRSVKVPIAFMLGRHDRQLEANQAADYFEALVATQKRLIWFEGSAHNIPFEEPDRFMAELKAAVKEIGG
ncbi:alpha/beta fold hydrolase [Bradyrhizobium elkanii]|uniref:alpha/beta fold hydrolase n=3 Tax=Bradyrhizobium elkanii TaxID=29448 RepID=UPI003517291D